MSTPMVALATAVLGLVVGFLLGTRMATPEPAPTTAEPAPTSIAAVPGEKGNEDIWGAYEPVVD